MKYEVKGYKGRFLPYGKIDPRLNMFEQSEQYLTRQTTAERFALFTVKRGNSRAGAGNGRAYVYIVSKEAVLNAIHKMQVNAKLTPALSVHNGAIVLKRYEFMAIVQTFGKAIEIVETDVTSWKDIKPDTGNAPYARAWEKICAKACNGKWCGGLNNVQIDFTVNEADD